VPHTCWRQLACDATSAGKEFVFFQSAQLLPCFLADQQNLALAQAAMKRITAIIVRGGPETNRATLFDTAGAGPSRSGSDDAPRPVGKASRREAIARAAEARAKPASG